MMTFQFVSLLKIHFRFFFSVSFSLRYLYDKPAEESYYFCVSFCIPGFSSARTNT